jgi:sugar phosphate isomerase/epimerase
MAALGFREVELYDIRDLAPLDLRAALQDSGLVCRTAQWPVWGDDAEIGGALDSATALDLEFMVIPLPKRMGASTFEPNDTPAGRRAVFDGMTVNDWRWTTDWFNHVGGIFQKANIQLVYQTHNFEFRKRGAGIDLDEMLGRVNEGRVKLEFDIGYAVAAGCDPVWFLKKYGDRVAALHVSDQKPGSPAVFGADPPVPTAAIGRGVTDWKRVIAAAREAGVPHWYLDVPPEALGESFRYLSGL